MSVEKGCGESGTCYLTQLVISGLTEGQKSVGSGCTLCRFSSCIELQLGATGCKPCWIQSGGEQTHQPLTTTAIRRLLPSNSQRAGYVALCLISPCPRTETRARSSISILHAIFVILLEDHASLVKADSITSIIDCCMYLMFSSQTVERRHEGSAVLRLIVGRRSQGNNSGVK